MIKNRFLVVSILLLLLSACGPKKLSEIEQAQLHLQKAEQFYKTNAFNAAKSQIDSINTFFPKQMAVRQEANTIKYQIELIESKRNLIYADNLYRLKKVEVDSICKQFKLEKDTSYQEIGNYIYKTQVTESTLGGTFIKAYVDEKGKLYLSSKYCSKLPINHNTARFSIGEIFAETEKVTDDGYTHYFKDGEASFESVIYRSKANAEIGALVQENSGKTIVVTLKGEKRKSTFWLTNNEKKAISEASNLSVFLTDLKNLERIINVSKKKIILLEDHLRVDKEETNNKTLK